MATNRISFYLSLNFLIAGKNKSVGTVDEDKILNYFNMKKFY